MLVTGATGFLGRHLLPALCRAGYLPRALVRRPESHAWMQRCPVEVVKGDVLDTDALRRAADGVDAVVHAAGVFRFWGDAAQMMRVNAEGTANVLRASHGVRRFIHISTVAVIGSPQPGRLLDETHPPQPADPYQRSKLAAEQQVIQAQHEYGTPVVIVRPGAFYGPLGVYGFNRLFFRDPMRGLIMQMDYGRHVIFPVYVGDVAQGVVLALEHGLAGETYNLCGAPISHRDAFDVVCAEAGLRWPRLSLPGWVGIAAAHGLEALSALTRREPFYPINLRSYVYNDWHVSSEKARLELGFRPLDFREGARRTIAWYRAGQPDWIPELAYESSQA